MKREREKEKGRKVEKMGISSWVVLLNEFGESIFPMARIFGRSQLSKSSLLNILLIKSRVLSFPWMKPRVIAEK